MRIADSSIFPPIQDQYIRSYAESFNAPQYIKFKHMVLSVEPADDYDLTGKWKVTVKNLETNAESTIVYDGVMVCTGHHVTPMTAQFPGQEKFKGKPPECKVYSL